MSDEIDENKDHIHSTFNSKDISNNNPTDNDTESPKSRLSSASKKKKEQQHEIVNHHINETRIKSPITPRQDINQVNNHQLTDENHSRSSFHVNEPIHDGPTTDNLHLISSQDEQNQLNSTGNSLDVTPDDENLNSSQRQSINTPRRGKKRNPLAPDSNEPIRFDEISEKPQIKNSTGDHPSCGFSADKKWLDLQYHSKDLIKKPDELQDEMEDPPGKIDEDLLDRIQGSIIGMALGDALGAHVEFRPHQYMIDNPVTKLEKGGTWGLEIGQFTDDTSMALCLANSLLARKDFVPYDQLVRYKWWHKFGYMSSTGQCFDIGAATSQSLHEFERRQKEIAKENNISDQQMDKLSDWKLLNEFPIYCSEDGVAGNGALMRLAPVPLFFYRNKYVAIEFSGRSGEITHGDTKARDACRFYGALIVAALRRFTKKQILARNFYSEHRHWFGEEPLHKDIISIAEGSYKKKGGYADGIRGKGYIVDALEAALWAFWSDKDSFEKGALAAVNLGDDTDTTAAIYGQLAGAHYGYNKLPADWVKQIYAHKFMKTLSKWIAYEGEQWERKHENSFLKE